MSEETPTPEKQPGPTATKESRASIINAVKTPLGFFTLGILVVEAIFALVVGVEQLDPPHRTLLIVGMIIALFLLFLFVAYLTFYRPEALQAGSAASLPEDAGELTGRIEQQRRMAESLAGDWAFVAVPKGDSAEPPMGRRGTCVMHPEGMALRIDGEWYDEHSGVTRNWRADEVHLERRELRCVFKIQQDKPGETVLGAARLRPIRDGGANNPVTRLVGTWGLVGENVYGDAEFTRSEETGNTPRASAEPDDEKPE